MSKTVKRVLWQRALETAGPLRKALPQAPVSAPGGISERLAVDVRLDTSALEAALARWQRDMEQGMRDLHAASARHAQTLRQMQDGIKAASNAMAQAWAKQMVREMNEASRET